MAAEKPADGMAQVTVTGNFQVSYEGRVYGPGESLRLPGDLAEKWQQMGLVAAV